MSVFSHGRSAIMVTLFAFLGGGPALAAPGDGQVRAQLAGVRVPFLANEGHVDARVTFYAATFAGTVFVTQQGEVVYALRGPSRQTDDGRARKVGASAPGWSLAETLSDGRPQPAAGPTADAHVNLFLGPDPAQHRSALSTYASINLGEVWPGVMVALHAVGQSVEKLFTVTPGASPERIRVRVDGATALRLTSEGALVAETGLGEVIFTAPVAYQDSDGVRRVVSAAYRLDGQEYGFALGAYDTTRPLVIDPILQSTFLGGAGSDEASALAIHPATGDVYVAGRTASTTFPGTTGGAQPSTGGASSDAFVARFSGTLTTLLQSTFLGGGSFDEVLALAIHPATGDVYVAGRTGPNPFPGAAGGAQPGTGGGQDAFVARLNSTLTTLLQSTYLGGSGSEDAVGLAIHPATGDVYVAGETNSATFPGTAGGAQASFGGVQDTYVARLNSALTMLLQSTYLGGSDPDEALALAIHPATGDVYVAGKTSSATFPGTAGGAQPSAGGGGDAFVTRLNSALTTLLQSTFLGGVGSDDARALAIHPATGDVYVAGFAGSPTFPGTAGGAQPSAGGGGDAFVTRLNSALTTLLQSTFLGGTGVDVVSALAIHPTTGDVYAAGNTDSTGFPGTAGGTQASKGGGGDAFVTRFNSTLTTLRQSTFLGGSSFDEALALAIHPATGDVYVAGRTESTTFPGTAGGPQPGSGGAQDAFLARLTADLRDAAACAGAAVSLSALQGLGLAAPGLGVLPLVAAVLPGGRSVQVGCTATAFATIINAGEATATGVGIAPQTVIPATFTYQTTDPLTNAVTGTPNTPVDIPAGQVQTYVIALTPTAPFGATDVALAFDGANTALVATLVGINTLLLSASATPTPDIVALGATVKNDGIVEIPGVNATGFFSVATFNVGASASITASTDTGSGSPDVTIALCQTNPMTGVCISALGPEVTTQINAHETPTFAVFVTGTAPVTFDPANNRVFVRFKDAGGATRGATSVAVRTR